MTVLPTIPDVELLVGGWLRAHPDIDALDARVAGRTPATQTKPWIRVTQIDAGDSTTSSVEYFLEYLLQLDCYAGEDAMTAHAGQSEASALVRAARAVLKDREGRAGDGVVVTQVLFQGMSRIPDISFEPARERFILTVLIRAHGIPA